MPNDLSALKTWMETYGDDAGDALLAGIELAGNLTAEKPDTKPQEIFTGIPAADQAIAEAAGVAAIAGARGVDAGDIIKVAGMLLSIGMTFV